MKLHYKKEHISCTNYKSESYEGFGIGTLTSGSNFNSQTLSVKTNFLIFILEGEVEIIPKEGKIKRVIAHNSFSSRHYPLTRYRYESPDATFI